jgi:hypothetical protein
MTTNNATKSNAIESSFIKIMLGVDNSDKLKSMNAHNEKLLTKVGSFSSLKSERFESLKDTDQKEITELESKINKKLERSAELLDLLEPVISKALEYVIEANDILQGEREKKRIERQLELLQQKQKELMESLGR